MHVKFALIALLIVLAPLLATAQTPPAAAAVPVQMTTPVEAGEEPLTDEQREAVAMVITYDVEMQRREDAMRVVSIMQRLAWTVVAVVIVLVLILAAEWLAVWWRAPALEDCDPDYDEPDLRDSRAWTHRRNGQRLHISRLSESPLKLPK